MGETTNQIENYIDHKREDLGSNLQELEQKVKSATDWKWQFQKNPMTMLGIAFGGGVMLAAMMGGGGRGRRRRDEFRYIETRPPAQHAGTERQKQKALETWDNIKGALIGVAATQFKSALASVVPGFQEQLHKTETEKDKTIHHTPPASMDQPVH